MNHVEYLGGFAEGGGVESLFDFFGRHFIGAAKEIQPRFYRITNHSIITRYRILGQLKNVDLQIVGQIQLRISAPQSKITVDIGRLSKHDGVQHTDADRGS